MDSRAGRGGRRRPGSGSPYRGNQALSFHHIHRPLLLPVYLPAMLLGIASQAVIVLLPLYALELGGSAAAASAVVGAHGMGMMAIDLPAGLLASRFGDKLLMLAAVGLIASAYAAFALIGGVAALQVAAFACGIGSSSFLLGRMSYVTAVCGPAERGRVIAMIAGNVRLSALLGPLAGGTLAGIAGFELAFAVAAVSATLAWIAMAIFADGTHEIPGEVRLRVLADLIVEYRAAFATAGVAVIVFMLLRAARNVLMPLMGAHLGLEVASIGLVVSISACVDVAAFYPAGLLMDRRGRRATAVPSSILLTFALAAIGAAQGFYSLVAAGILAGVANGLSTGIVMTLGTDHAPRVRRGEFLGLWRLLTDSGSAAGPMAIAAIVAVAPIGIAALSMAAIGAAGSLFIYWFVEETLPQARAGP